MTDKPPKKVRADFRKNRTPRPRQIDVTRQFRLEGERLEDASRAERITGKGDISRKRTIRVSSDAEPSSAAQPVMLEVDDDQCMPGRVMRVHGRVSDVLSSDGKLFQCTTRGLLRTLATDQRQAVVVGDRVRFRPSSADEGFIERIEQRHGTLSRSSRSRQHVLVSNVDQLVIVTSAAEPQLKPNFIDRFLVTAELSQVEAIICVNKIDLVDVASLEPLVGVYSQLGYEVHLVSVRTGQGVERIRRQLVDRETVVAGQSGVGKSSLLNSIETGLALRVSAVSAENQKGRHTTTSAVLLPLAAGGFVVDTPGIRQFRLWDQVAGEIASAYRDLRPFVSRCRFPDCTHTHETDCAVKDAVADDLIDARRYESYCHLLTGEDD